MPNYGPMRVRVPKQEIILGLEQWELQKGSHQVYVGYVHSTSLIASAQDIYTRGIVRAYIRAGARTTCLWNASWILVTIYDRLVLHNHNHNQYKNTLWCLRHPRGIGLYAETHTPLQVACLASDWAYCRLCLARFSLCISHGAMFAPRLRAQT